MPARKNSYLREDVPCFLTPLLPAAANEEQREQVLINALRPYLTCEISEESRGHARRQFAGPGAVLAPRRRCAQEFVESQLAAPYLQAGAVREHPTSSLETMYTIRKWDRI